jgi:tetratricopeptide (TPR) repeat protein
MKCCGAFVILKAEMTNSETIAASENAAKNLAEREQWRDAAKELLRAARAEPGNAARWLQIAQWQRQSGDARSAASTLRTALRLNKKSAQRTPEDDIALHQALAEAHLETQNWEEAITVCQALLKLAPRHHFAQELLATALLQSGKLDEAERVMRGLIAQSPRDPLHRLRLATLLQLQGRLGEATREFERIIELHPDFALAADAHDAVETLDRMQTQQVLVLASEQLAFRRRLETDLDGALESLNFHLSESGYDSLKNMIWDGSLTPETPLRLH